jgi:hypothetical protein
MAPRQKGAEAPLNLAEPRAALKGRSSTVERAARHGEPGCVARGNALGGERRRFSTMEHELVVFPTALEFTSGQGAKRRSGDRDRAVVICVGMLGLDRRCFAIGRFADDHACCASSARSQSLRSGAARIGEDRSCRHSRCRSGMWKSWIGRSSTGRSFALGGGFLAAALRLCRAHPAAA